MIRQDLYKRYFHDGLGINYVAQTILIVVLVTGVNNSFSLGINAKSDSLRALLLVASDTTKVNRAECIGQTILDVPARYGPSHTFVALMRLKKSTIEREKPRPFGSPPGHIITKVMKHKQRLM